MNIEALTKHLIQIPSYVDSSVNEKAIADFIVSFLTKNTSLLVEQQTVEAERYNIVAYSETCRNANGKFDVDTLFINHIDTVEPKNGSTYDQFLGVEKNGKIYGLGSADTKGNVAVLMKLAEQIVDQKCMFLFYVDEEYHFKGIMSFIKRFKNKLTVKKIISADGENLQIRNASRGVLSLDFVLRGKTGHAANPKNGINVISAFNRIFLALEKKSLKKSDTILGKSSLNIAYVRAGLNRGKSNDTQLLGRNGNNIPDYLEATVEFRLNSFFTLKQIKEYIMQLAKKEKVKVEISNKQYNCKPWVTPKNKLKFIDQALTKNNIPVTYTNPAITGYVDIGLLQESFPSVCCCIGARGKNRHGVNEYVERDSLYKLYDVFKLLIKSY